MSDVVVLIQSSDSEPWSSMREAQIGTWVAEAPAEVEVLFYRSSRSMNQVLRVQESVREALRFGRTGAAQRLLDRSLRKRLNSSAPLLHDDGSFLVVDTYRSKAHLGAALLAALEYVKQRFSPSLVFRTNASSYVNVSRLVKLHSRVGSSIDYGGFVESGAQFWGWNFVNGAGVLLSNRAVTSVTGFGHDFDHRYLEDVALGKLFHEVGIPATHINRPLITSIHDIEKLTHAELSAHHFRIRSQARYQDEHILMRLLHQRIVTELGCG